MITADLDQQLHGWSIDAIDNHDGCIICLENLSGSQVENCSLSSHVSELMDGDVEVGILNKLVNADALCEVSRITRKPVGCDPVFIVFTRVEYWHENVFAGVDDALFLLE